MKNKFKLKQINLLKRSFLFLFYFQNNNKMKNLKKLRHFFTAIFTFFFVFFWYYYYLFFYCYCYSCCSCCCSFAWISILSFSFNFSLKKNNKQKFFSLYSKRKIISEGKLKQKKEEENSSFNTCGVSK